MTIGNIDSPATYGEFWANMQREVLLSRSEQREQSFGPMLSQVLADAGLLDIIPEPLQPFITTIQSPNDPDWDDVQRMFLGTLSRGVGIVGGEEMARPFKYEAAEKFLSKRMSANPVMTLFMRKKIDKELFDGRMHSEGYADSESRHLYNSMQPYPTIPELIRFGRYHSEPDNPKDFVWKLFDVHPDDWEMWNWLSFQKLTTEQVQRIYRRGGFDKNRSELELSRLGWPIEEREALLNLAYDVPNAMLLVQGDLMQGIPDSDIISDISLAGIHNKYASRYLDGVLTKPNTREIIDYMLRVDPSLSGIDAELRKIGIHPSYFDTYKTLAHPIPPVNDLITMAVREAFTPEIATRFGQYEGLPTEYVEAAAQKGLTKEWAERYWASHWTLPSVSQGFEMLHRGIIDQSDLNLLLRALDIMPFWRDKLIQLSYKPLTRVDVRRMHLLGTLDEGGVKRAYLDVGYSDRNANLMTDFTVRYNRRSLSGFTQRDAISAYINRFIEAGQTQSILRDIGTKDSEIPNVMRLATLKREWKYKNERIQAIGNLYRKGKKSYAQTRNDLSALGLASDYVITLLEQWEAKAESEKTATLTKADTLKLYSLGLIDENRARLELQLLGYNKERENLLMQSVQGQTA